MSFALTVASQNEICNDSIISLFGEEAPASLEDYTDGYK